MLWQTPFWSEVFSKVSKWSSFIKFISPLSDLRNLKQYHHLSAEVKTFEVSSSWSDWLNEGLNEWNSLFLFYTAPSIFELLSSTVMKFKDRWRCIKKKKTISLLIINKNQYFKVLEHLKSISLHVVTNTFLIWSIFKKFQNDLHSLSLYHPSLIWEISSSITIFQLKWRHLKFHLLDLIGWMRG